MLSHRRTLRVVTRQAPRRENNRKSTSPFPQPRPRKPIPMYVEENLYLCTKKSRVPGASRAWTCTYVHTTCRGINGAPLRHPPRPLGFSNQQRAVFHTSEADSCFMPVRNDGPGHGNERKNRAPVWNTTGNQNTHHAHSHMTRYTHATYVQYTQASTHVPGNVYQVEETHTPKHLHTGMYQYTRTQKRVLHTQPHHTTPPTQHANNTYSTPHTKKRPAPHRQQCYQVRIHQVRTRPVFLGASRPLFASTYILVLVFRGAVSQRGQSHRGLPVFSDASRTPLALMC